MSAEIAQLTFDVDSAQHLDAVLASTTALARSMVLVDHERVQARTTDLQLLRGYDVEWRHLAAEMEERRETAKRQEEEYLMQRAL